MPGQFAADRQTRLTLPDASSSRGGIAAAQRRRAGLLLALAALACVAAGCDGYCASCAVSYHARDAQTEPSSTPTKAPASTALESPVSTSSDLPSPTPASR